MAPTASSYDLFLSYNSADHTLVEEIARKIRDQRLEPFLDRWYLVPGARWRPRLEQILSSCKAVAIFVGAGEWAVGSKEKSMLRLTFRPTVKVSR